MGSAPDAPRKPFASSPELKSSGQPVGSLSPRLSRAVGKPAAPAAATLAKQSPVVAPAQEPAEPKIEELWAVDFGNEDRELTLPVLVESIRSGEVKNDTLVWRVGMSGWQSAAEVTELAVYFADSRAKPNASPFAGAEDDEKEVVAVASSSALDADVVTSAPTPAIKPAAPTLPTLPTAAAPTPAAAAPAGPPTGPRAAATPPALPAQAAHATPPALPAQVVTAPHASPQLVDHGPATPAAAPAPGAPGGPILSDVTALLRAQESRKKKAIIIGAALGVAVIVILLILMATSGGTSEAPPTESASTDTPLTISTKPRSTAAAGTAQAAPTAQGKSFSEMFAAAASANSGSVFDAEEARSVVEGATAQLAGCRGLGSQPGSVSVEVSFAPRGMAISAKVGPPYGGTPPGGCMESALKSLRVKPFSGASGSLKATLRLP